MRYKGNERSVESNRFVLGHFKILRDTVIMIKRVTYQQAHVMIDSTRQFFKKKTPTHPKLSQLQLSKSFVCILQ